MRLSIVKKSHQQLLLDIAASLRSDDPRDGLEHLLNLYLVSPPISLSTEPTAAPMPEPDDISALASWE